MKLSNKPDKIPLAHGENGQAGTTIKSHHLSPDRAFALVLETACEDFEIMQSIIKNEIRIEARKDLIPTPINARLSRAPARIGMALAKSFVANVIRAQRICRHGAQHLKLDKSERDYFMKSIPDIQRVRDVNEHGYDVSGNDESKPTMHKHELDSATLDETAMVILGPEKILMGPINLFDVYRVTSRMRDLAGFAALASTKAQAR